MERASDHSASQEGPEATTSAPALNGAVLPAPMTTVLALQASAGNSAVGYLLSGGRSSPGRPSARAPTAGRDRAESSVARLSRARTNQHLAAAVQARSATPAARAVHRQPTPAPATPEAPAVTTRSFSPTKGIVIDQTDKSMHISGKIESYGQESNAANAAAAEATIRKYWNQSFPDGYSVTCDVTVTAGTGSASDAAKISMEKASKDSHVSRITGVMSLNMNESDALSWTVAHEFGHQLGLKDRYSEAIMSKLRGAVGLKRTGSTANPGYEGNLMADVSGATESKNVRDLSTENSPWYWQTDDEVRDWIARQGTKLGGLSTATKIAMINKLFEGWISDDDVEAIGAICRSATPGPQATAIKSHLTSRLLDMTSIGQRTRVRVFIAQMP